MPSKPNSKREKSSSSYGIGEWYGKLFTEITNPKLKEYAGLSSPKLMECRFRQALPELAPKGKTVCTKKGGVCSIRKFSWGDENVSFGPITTTCPSRFLEDGIVFRFIGEQILCTQAPIIVKEVPFLRRIKTNDDDQSNYEVDDGKEDVGRIDMVLVHPDLSELRWCALEMQAVYFSGGGMNKDFHAIKNHHGNGLPMPAVYRRPDFRSSGPKRLMPQLQIKVPTLRRWGRKMAIVVDKPFLMHWDPWIMLMTYLIATSYGLLLDTMKILKPDRLILRWTKFNSQPLREPLRG